MYFLSCESHAELRRRNSNEAASFYVNSAYKSMLKSHLSAGSVPGVSVVRCLEDLFTFYCHLSYPSVRVRYRSPVVALSEPPFSHD
jgi:hypothetical protein